MKNKTATECWNILRGELDSAIDSYCCAQLVKRVVYPGLLWSACTTGVDHVVLPTEGIT